MGRDRRTIRFMHALVSAGCATRKEGGYIAGGVTLSGGAVRALAAQGLLDSEADICTPRPEARAWLKRAMLDEDAFAAQHRLEARAREGQRLNLAESPLSRLGTGHGGSEPFLARHQLEAGERVRGLVERAQLRPRLTMSYSPAHTAGGKHRGPPGEISDVASDARRRLNAIIGALPDDCAGVVLDVCGLLKGLQQVETERGWPRRSAKLVLRIGLDQVARLMGLAPEAVGLETRRRHAWLDEGARPTTFG